MALYLPVRALNRSSQVRVGGTKLSPTATTYVDISDGPTRKELSSHSAINQYIVVGPASTSQAPQKVVSGIVVDEGASAADRILGNSAGEIRLDTGAYVTVAANTTAVTLAAAHATLGRKDIVHIDSAGTVGFTTGTASATPAVPSTPSGKTLLAIVTRAALDDAIANAEILDSRERV